ncbi:hypothetical protein QYF61_024131 [Mycteria americana]|uniref:Tetratricopeptide repeat protein 29 n=1 Tax=Mycteria americana TaxID=33587 RepID=A0AAN7N414_MYCAM|nr:hypothetical protein QYF61_024131 [Mycteria americana]
MTKGLGAPVLGGEAEGAGTLQATEGKAQERSYLLGSSTEEGTRLFSVMFSDRTTGNGHKLKYMRFHLNSRRRKKLLQGKVPEAIKYLGDFMKAAENAHLSQSLVDACVLLGNIYNERAYFSSHTNFDPKKWYQVQQGNYNEAFEYFTRASEAAKTLNNLPLVEETKTYCGIAKAHKLMVAFNSHIEAEDPVSLKYLLAWKENRSGMCTDPLTVVILSSRTSPYHSTEHSRLVSAPKVTTSFMMESGTSKTWPLLQAGVRKSYSSFCLCTHTIPDSNAT